MGSCRISPIASARIAGGSSPSVDTNITSGAVASVTRLSAGRYQLNCESNSQWDTTNTTVHVTPESANGTAVLANVEPRVSGAYVVINTYTMDSYGATSADYSFYVDILDVKAAWD